jgi:membrane protein YqaA with SNARE-associated domain
LGCVIAIVRLLRPELEATAQWFVSRYGVWGLAMGTLIADGFHVPVPAQFYMLLGLSSGIAPGNMMVAICVGSSIGGVLSYLIGGQLQNVNLVKRWLAKPTELAAAALKRYGAWALVAVSVLPLGYSTLCCLCGLSRVAPRYFALVAVLRVPRLFVYFYIIKVGYHVAL